MRRLLDAILTILFANRILGTIVLTAILLAVPLWLKYRHPSLPMPPKKPERVAAAHGPAAEGEGVPVYDETLTMQIPSHPWYFTVPFPVKKGDILTVSATGTITWQNAIQGGIHRKDTCGPQGEEFLAKNAATDWISKASFRAPPAPVGSLIGAIGRLRQGIGVPVVRGTEHFLIGSMSTFTAPRSGMLHLTVNDSFRPEAWQDNAGGWTVHVTIRREGKKLKAVPTRPHEYLQEQDALASLDEQINAEIGPVRSPKWEQYRRYVGSLRYIESDEPLINLEGEASGTERLEKYRFPTPTWESYAGRDQVHLIYPVSQSAPGFIEFTYYIPRAGRTYLVASYASGADAKSGYWCKHAGRNDFLARIVAKPKGGGRQVLEERITRQGEGWIERKFPLDRFRGQIVTVRFEACAGGLDSWCCEVAAIYQFYVLVESARP